MSAINRKFKCLDCGHEWEGTHGKGRPDACPKCGSKNIRRAPPTKVYARLGKGHRGHFEI